MDTKVLSSGIRYTNLPESYVRPESERPRLSEVSVCENIPVIDLESPNRAETVKQIGDACKFYGFFQVKKEKRNNNQTLDLVIYWIVFVKVLLCSLTCGFPIGDQSWGFNGSSGKNVGGGQRVLRALFGGKDEVVLR